MIYNNTVCRSFSNTPPPLPPPPPPQYHLILCVSRRGKRDLKSEK